MKMKKHAKTTGFWAERTFAVSFESETTWMAVAHTAPTGSELSIFSEFLIIFGYVLALNVFKK